MTATNPTPVAEVRVPAAGHRTSPETIALKP